MLTLLRVLLLPLRHPVGRRVLVAAFALAALWWWQGDQIARWFGPPRPPEGRVQIELSGALSPDALVVLELRFGDRYGDLGDDRLRAHRAALSDRYHRERRAALDARRAAGLVLERPYASGGPTAVPPEVPLDAIAEVALDPVESKSSPVAWTIWLPREQHLELYDLRAELRYVEHLLERGVGSTERP